MSYLILATQMMPPVVLMIPLYVIVRQMGLVDTLYSLVLVNAIFTLPVTTWMLKSIFDTISVELEEAGMVDGCTRMGVLWRITIPIAIPGFIASGLFAFIASWDEYMFARTVITTPRFWVGTIGIVSFIGEWQAPWDQINAAAFLFTLVPVALFLMVQKYFIVGIVGGVKGKGTSGIAPRTNLLSLPRPRTDANTTGSYLRKVFCAASLHSEEAPRLDRQVQTITLAKGRRFRLFDVCYEFDFQKSVYIRQ